MDAFNYGTSISPEVWAIIFDKLQSDSYNSDRKTLSFSDLLNCSRTCRKFYNILSLTKCRWLFPEVFHLLFPYIPKESILPIRETCKAWKHVVDRFIENYQRYLIRARQVGQLINHPMAVKRHDFMNRSIFEDSITFPVIRPFDSNEKICEFLTKMKDHHGNPFPGRVLSLDYSSIAQGTAEERNLFWESNVPELLSRFGHHVFILYLNLCCSEQHALDCSSFYGKITNLFFSLPNIKQFYCRGNIYQHIVSSTRNWFPDIRATYVVPPKIETVEFDGSDIHYLSLPSALQYHIGVRGFVHLKRLKLSLMEANERRGYPRWLPGNLPELEELELKILSSAQLHNALNWTKNSTKLRSICVKLMSAPWRRDFNLRSLMYAGDPVFYFYDIVSPIHKQFGKFLETLIIVVSIPLQRDWKIVTSQLDLETLSKFESLKYLHVEGFNFQNLQLLEYLPVSLEFLLLDGIQKWSKDILKMAGVSMDLPDGESICESRLWILLPHLKWLSVAHWERARNLGSSLFHRGQSWENFVGLNLEKMLDGRVIRIRCQLQCCCITPLMWHY